jgi:hypothetical protein
LNKVVDDILFSLKTIRLEKGRSDAKQKKVEELQPILKRAYVESGRQ